MIVYAADSPDQRLTIALDALTLVYHRASGQTHMLAEPAPQILDALNAGAADAAEIVRRLAESHDFESDEAAAVVTARLIELEAIGLALSFSPTALAGGVGGGSSSVFDACSRPEEVKPPPAPPRRRGGEQ